MRARHAKIIRQGILMARVANEEEERLTASQWAVVESFHYPGWWIAGLYCAAATNERLNYIKRKG